MTEGQLAAADQPGQASSRPHTVRNRRLAALQRLQAQGQFFSEAAMRERAPLLHHQLLGQYMGDGTEQRGAHSAGGLHHRASLSEVLMRQHDEVELRLQMHREQQQEEAQLSEQESSSDDEHECGRDGNRAAAQQAAAAGMTDVELSQRRRDFQQVRCLSLSFLTDLADASCTHAFLAGTMYML